MRRAIQPTLRSLFITGVAMFAVGQAQASVILFDNFNGATGYNPSLGWTIGAGGFGASFVQGDAFTTPAGGPFTLESITAAITHAIGINTVELTLRADTAGAPGAIIETFNIGPFPAFGTPDMPTTVLSASNPILGGATQYWLVANTPNLNSSNVWNLNSIGDSGPHAQSSDGGPFLISNQTRGAFRVTAFDSAAIPEPTSLALLGLTAAGFCGVRIRRRRQDANTDNTQSA